MRRLICALTALGMGAALAWHAPPAAAADTGMVRVAHLSPDSPAVDVTVDGGSAPAVTVPGLGYGDVSDYRALPAGSYTVSVRAAGADPASPPVLSTTVDVQAGRGHTPPAGGGFARPPPAGLPHHPSGAPPRPPR